MKKNRLRTYLYRVYNKIGLSTPPTGSLLYKFNEKLMRVGISQPTKNTMRVENLGRKPAFRIFILDGIGDALWSLTLLPAVLESFQVSEVEFVLPDIESVRKSRSEEFLLRFPFVSGVSYVKTQIHKVNSWDTEGGLNYSHSIGPSKSTLFDYSLVANPYLERGIGYEEIAKLLGLRKDVINFNPMDQFPEREEDSRIFDLFLDKKQYCVVYMGSESDNSITGLNRGALFSKEDWERTLEEIGKRGFTIVLVGAQYDISYSHKVIQLLSPGVDVINLMGITSLPELIFLQRRARFTIGLASGVTIMAPYLNTDAAIFFRDEEFPMSPYFPYSRFLEGFATDWLPFTYSNQYLPLWYGRDNSSSVVKQLIELGII
jgi:hypothetical protein